MLRRLIIAAIFASAIASGCKCSCDNDITVGGNKDAGGPGGGLGDGGTGGGNPDGGGDVDAGDGTTTTTIGPGTGGFVLDGGVNDAGVGGVGDGVKLDPSGYIVLNSGEIALHYAWIANAASGWVSKFDTSSGSTGQLREVARYWSVVPRDGLGNPLPLVYNAITQNSPSGNSPSRTAVDLFGDVWVANRAPEIQGSVTKIANDLSECVDRNGNGKIDTSSDKNGDGVIDTDPAAGEFITPTDPNDPNTYDECVLFSTLVGPPGGGVKARALAIAQGIEGSAGEIWVGIHVNKTAIKLKATNGQQIPVNSTGTMEIQFPGMTSGPYGAAVDSQQRLWMVDALTAHLALIDTKTGTLVSDTLVSPVSTGSYAIGIDGKDRVWLAGWDGSYASRYDHGPGVNATPGTWTKFDFTSQVHPITGRGFGLGRGIAADDKGNVFMSAYNWNGQAVAQLIGFDGDTGVIRPFNSAQGQLPFVDATDGNTHTSIGVALDADGNIWVNNYSGNAMKLDRNTGDVVRTSSQAGGGLYTYSDFTGYQLRKFTAPRGTYKHTFIGCSSATQWKELVWDADVPPKTKVEVYVRVGNTLAELDSPTNTKYGPFPLSPLDLQAAGIPPSLYLRVEFVLTSQDAMTTPVLKGFNVAWACGGGIN